MTLKILFAAHESRWPIYQTALRRACDEKQLDVNIRTDFSDPATVDYIIYAPNSALQDFAPYVNAKAVLNLWAGVEDIVGNPTLTIPLCRMVDDGLNHGMVEWVTGHVLRHHLEMDRHINGQDGQWRDYIPPLAKDRHVGILGLGELGSACAAALGHLRFNLSGWSRSPKKITGITCHAGAGGLKELLAQSEILVLLLPKTAETENILNTETLAMLPKGAVIINPGRGALIDDEALLSALDSGWIAHATLDVFRTEPLPADHRFWAHPNVTVTPHIASETRPDSASRVIAENIRRGEAHAPFLFLVDRAAGY